MWEWIFNASEPKDKREGRKRHVLTRGLPWRSEWDAYGDIYLTAALSRRPAVVYFEDVILP